MRSHFLTSMFALVLLCGCDQSRDLADANPTAAPEPQFADAKPATRPAAALVPDDIRHLYMSYKQLELVLMTPKPFSIPRNSVSIAGCRIPTPLEEAIESAASEPASSRSVNVYMNAPAAGALAHRNEQYPVGSVVVKEKLSLSSDGTTRIDAVGLHDGIGGMVKRAPGYDPKHGDWEYFYGESLETLVSGKISNCVECHRLASKSDYVFGHWGSGSYNYPAPGRR